MFKPIISILILVLASVTFVQAESEYKLGIIYKDKCTKEFYTMATEQTILRQWTYANDSATVGSYELVSAENTWWPEYDSPDGAVVFLRTTLQENESVRLAQIRLIKQIKNMIGGALKGRQRAVGLVA